MPHVPVTLALTGPLTGTLPMPGLSSEAYIAGRVFLAPRSSPYQWRELLAADAVEVLAQRVFSEAAPRMPDVRAGVGITVTPDAQGVVIAATVTPDDASLVLAQRAYDHPSPAAAVRTEDVSHQLGHDAFDRPAVSLTPYSLVTAVREPGLPMARFLGNSDFLIATDAGPGNGTGWDIKDSGVPHQFIAMDSVGTTVRYKSFIDGVGTTVVQTDTTVAFDASASAPDDASAILAERAFRQRDPVPVVARPEDSSTLLMGRAFDRRDQPAPVRPEDSSTHLMARALLPHPAPLTASVITARREPGLPMARFGQDGEFTRFGEAGPGNGVIWDLKDSGVAHQFIAMDSIGTTVKYKGFIAGTGTTVTQTDTTVAFNVVADDDSTVLAARAFALHAPPLVDYRQFTALAGRAGTANDTTLTTTAAGTGKLYGGSAADANLGLYASSNATPTGYVDVNPSLRVRARIDAQYDALTLTNNTFPSTVASVTANSLMSFGNGTLTLAGLYPTFSVLSAPGTVLTSSGASTGNLLFNHQTVNTNTDGINPSTMYVVNDAAFLKATTTSGARTCAGWQSLRSYPTFEVATGAFGLTVNSLAVISASGAVKDNVTLAARVGLSYAAMVLSGTGSVTSDIAVDVSALTATTSVALRSAVTGPTTAGRWCVLDTGGAPSQFLGAVVRSYSPTSFTIPDNYFSIFSKRQTLTGTQRVTLQGTARWQGI